MDIKKRLELAATERHAIPNGPHTDAAELARDALAEIVRLEELVAAAPRHYARAAHRCAQLTRELEVKKCQVDELLDEVDRIKRERELSAEASATLRDECLAAKSSLERSELAFAMLTERAVRLERELDQARSLPPSIQEALNSGDGSYRP
jgi:phage shock protein A